MLHQEINEVNWDILFGRLRKVIQCRKVNCMSFSPFQITVHKQMCSCLTPSHSLTILPETMLLFPLHSSFYYSAFQCLCFASKWLFFFSPKLKCLCLFTLELATQYAPWSELGIRNSSDPSERYLFPHVPWITKKNQNYIASKTSWIYTFIYQ